MKAAGRIVFESLGISLFVGVHVAAMWIFIIGSTLCVPPLVYWPILGLGYLGVPVLATFKRRVFGGVSWRALLDVWLLAFLAAVIATAGLIAVKLPLRSVGWDAHGAGASGGEANAMFLPWLHIVLWWAMYRVPALAKRREGSEWTGNRP
jgi:hypothetical protein